MKNSLSFVLLLGFLFLQRSYAQTPVGKDSISLASPGVIYNMPDYEASFPGGWIARNKYFYRFIDKNQEGIRGDSTQFCYLKFVVDRKGNISDVTTNNKIETKLGEVLIEALNTGPKWIPARQNGVKVNAYCSLTFIFEPKKTAWSALGKKAIKYYITRENDVEKNFKKILILVAGTVPARIFTDNLYENLKTDFEKNDIQSAYLFLGNEKKTALKKFNNISGSTNFDAILFFMQEDGARINEIEYGTEISTRSVVLKQSMNISLIEPGQLDTAIFEAKVFMNFQLQKKSAYVKASKNFLKILQQNRIISTGDGKFK